jgi:hypothetical protein
MFKQNGLMKLFNVFDPKHTHFTIRRTEVSDKPLEETAENQAIINLLKSHGQTPAAKEKEQVAAFKNPRIERFLDRGFFVLDTQRKFAQSTAPKISYKT